MGGKLAKKPRSEDSTQLLSLKQAAERLGLSDWTIRRWAAQGRIRSVKLGGRRLIPESTIARVIEKNEQRAACCPELRLD